MTKLLHNKTLRTALAIIMAVLLVVSLIPAIQPAYGTDAQEQVLATEVFDNISDRPANTTAGDSADAEDSATEGAVNGGMTSKEHPSGNTPSDASEPEDSSTGAGEGDTLGPEQSSDGQEEGLLTSVGAQGAMDSDNEELMSFSSPEEEANAVGDPDADPQLKSLEDMVNALKLEGFKEIDRQFTIPAGETLSANLRYEDKEEHTLTVDGTLIGTIYVSNGSTLNLKGSGTIDGNGAPTVIHVEGGNSVLNVNKDDGDNCICITGGNRGTKLNDSFNFPNYYSGGGILVQRKGVILERGSKDTPDKRGTGGTSATLNLYNGKIYGNKAGSGAGIHIDRDCSFYMENATIYENETIPQYQTIDKEEKYIPAHEGGGIYIAGSSYEKTVEGKTESYPYTYIASGVIEDNKTNTQIDWGGGGIFVESKGALKIDSAEITKNTAYGLGGGVAGCPHAHIGLGANSFHDTNGAIIWQNEAQKTKQPLNGYLTILYRKDYGNCYGDLYAYGLKKEDYVNPNGKISEDQEGNVILSEQIKIQDNVKKYFENDDWYKGGIEAGDAQDYYCTMESYIEVPDYSEYLSDGVVWKGCAVNDKGREDLRLKSGQIKQLDVGSVGLTCQLTPEAIDPDNPESVTLDRAVIIRNNTSTTHGGGIGCNGLLLVGNLPTGETHDSLSLSFKKELKTSLGQNAYLGEYEFGFELKDEANNLIATANTGLGNNDGMFTFSIPYEKLTEYIDDKGNGKATFWLSEIIPDLEDFSDPLITYDSDSYQITVLFRVNPKHPKIVKNQEITHYAIEDVSVSIADSEGKLIVDSEGEAVDYSNFAVVNTYNVKGEWTPVIEKYYHGNLAGGEDLKEAFKFHLTEIESMNSFDGVSVDDVAENATGASYESANGAFPADGGPAEVAFERVEYTSAGSHYYYIIEENFYDPMVYVVQVDVTENPDSQEVVLDYKAEVTAVYAADSKGSRTFTKIGTDLSAVEFHNNDADYFNISGYAVNASTGTPMMQKCLVDPKIIKELYGRTLTPGEFEFQLIEVNDYTETNGPVISATSNDEFGMVDFDKAANKAGEGESPSCLLFTQPGTYKYRVIEDPNQAADPSVDYSDQIITFTVVVDLDPETGILAASDMYYGYVNEDGENVRYKEQYDGWETKGEDWEPAAGDYADYNPEWHPTMVNVAKPMDLAVRKTSALTGEGLEGATYALYMVNNGDEADIKLGSSSSDTDGWIYFEDVALKEGNLYYFLEEAAPEGHTVSKFRSKYFYLTPDASAPNGFVLSYTDSKFAAGEPAALFAEDASNASAPTTGKDGALLYTYAADGGVKDEATYVEFNKLDAKNHEWVEGATLSVIEKDTGLVVNTWVSGTAPEILQKELNVGVIYVLRENEAPEGYNKAADVEFRIGEYGEIEILSGNSNGNAELSGSTITLYDTRIPIEEVVIEEREKIREVPGESKVENVINREEDTVNVIPSNVVQGATQTTTQTPGQTSGQTPGQTPTSAQDAKQVSQDTPLAQTGDMKLFIALGLLVIAGISAGAVVLLRRRKGQRS